MTDSNVTKKSDTRIDSWIGYTTLVFILFGFVVGIVGLAKFASYQKECNDDIQSKISILGEFGSFLSGSVGTIWSLAGVILIYLALREQRRDVKINQDALNAQIEVNKDQSATFKAQGFENTLFQLLQLQSNTLRDMSYWKDDSRQPQSKGKDVFADWIVILERLALGDLVSGGEDVVTGLPIAGTYVNYTSTIQIEQAFMGAYDEAYEPLEDSLNHYFRQLYHLFKYVHESVLIDNDRRKFYASLIRAQLSQNQLHALLYNSINPKYGKPKFLFLIKEYDVLKNFNFNAVKQQIILEYYNSELDKVQSPFSTSNP